MPKTVAIVIRTSPLNTLKSVEAFRLGIGLTLQGNKVKLLLTESGAWNALPLKGRLLERPDADQFIQSMELCGVDAYVDSESLPASLLPGIRPEFRIRTNREVMEIIERAEEVIPY